jgi:hypothetical protein
MQVYEQNLIISKKGTTEQHQQKLEKDLSD